MKKIIYFLLLGSSLLLQSCFEIIEQVFVRNDGSGNFNLVINMSKSKTKLNSVMKMKTVNGRKVPDKAEINKKAAEIESLTRKTPGVSNVKTSLDFTNFIAAISFDFSKVENVNAVVKNVSAEEKNPGATYIYGFKGNVFSRMNKFGIGEAYKKLSHADKEIFSTAIYTSIYRFENELASANNRSAKISPNKKAVMLKLNALDIISGNNAQNFTSIIRTCSCY
jgi:hypothetical protein